MRRLSILFLALGLSACGAINSPVVTEETTAVGAVDIVEINANTVKVANSSTYSPKTLPAVFSRTTGLTGSTGGFGAIPSPVNEEQIRPGDLPTRLPPATQPSSYKIGVGDVLVIAVPSNQTSVEQLTGLLAAQNRRNDFTVQDDGNISIPDVGRVNVAGLSIQEAETTVFDALVSSGMEPTFSLEVAQFNAHQITIGGEVRNPGRVPIQLTPLTLSDAINAAGGVTARESDYATIRLFRSGQMYEIPVTRFHRDSGIQNTVLTSGDSLYVDNVFDLDQAQAYFQQQIAAQNLRVNARAEAVDQLATEIGLRRAELNEKRANFAEKVQFDAVDRDYVYIAGEVGAQSRFVMPFERKSSLADALFAQAEGVPNATGNISEVYVLRGTGDGTGIKAWHLDAYNAANLVLATRFELRPNDVIFVSEKPLTSLTRVLAQAALVIGFAVP